MSLEDFVTTQKRRNKNNANKKQEKQCYSNKGKKSGKRFVPSKANYPFVTKAY